MNPWDSPTVPVADDDEGAGAAAAPTRLGHFEIVGRLGAGGMGLVFEGRDALLDRRVALKLIHPRSAGGAIAPARLLREAQALARLAHPNVVTVYEVGMAGDDPFIAMELVEGTTLADWMREPRAWRDVLDVFLAVGHGLAAVHALGLVHRDFKPSNVLVDRRGVPKLGDFGLVGATDERARAATETSRDGETPPQLATGSGGALTEPGAVMGTPAYMAPEQRHGGAVDARADQYSFAKSLREALGEPVPAALQPILDRALASDAADRYPAMDVLLADLARVRRGNRNRWIAAGAVVAVTGAVALAWGFGRAQAGSDPCARPTERIGAIWSPARRAALGAHLAAIDPTYGGQRFAVAAGTFDRGAERWLDQHVDACRLSRAGRQSDALLDRRMACLDRALFELDQTVDVLEASTNVISLDDALRAAVRLPTLDECADVAALTEKLPQPTNPLQRAEAQAIARDTVDIDVALRTGGTRTGVAPRAAAAVARARSLGHPETLARALRSLAAIQLEDETGDATIGTLREAITAASAAHDDRVVAELWSRLLSALVKRKHLAEAKTLVPAGEAALARSTPTVELDVGFLDAKAQVAASTGDVARALQLYADAMARLEAAGAATPGSPLAPKLLEVKTQRALMHAYAQDWARMVEELRPVVALTDAQYGPDHPAAMRVHFNLAVGLRHVRDDAGALAEFRTAARIGEARSAPSPNLVSMIQAVGSTLFQIRAYAEALPYCERALAMARQVMGPDDIRLANAINDVASTLIELKRYDEARTLLAEQAAIYERVAKPGDLNWAHTVFNQGNLEFKVGNWTKAIAILERAYPMYVATDQKGHYDADSTLTLIGDCYLNLHQYAAAQAISERVLAQTDSDPEMTQFARFIHGRAVFYQGKRAAGLAEIRAARAGYVAADLGYRAEEVDQWYAQHAIPTADR